MIKDLCPLHKFKLETIIFSSINMCIMTITDTNMKDGCFLVLYQQVFRIKPPMCITEDDVHFAVAVMRKVLREYEGSRN